MNGPFDGRSEASLPFITSTAPTSPWTRMRPSHGLHNQRPARSFKSATSAAYNTTTNVAPPDDRSPPVTPDDDARGLHRVVHSDDSLASPDSGVVWLRPQQQAGDGSSKAVDRVSGRDTLNGADGVS